MPKAFPAKSKPPPWIPPGRNIHKKKSTTTTHKKDDDDITSPKRIVNTTKSEDEDHAKELSDSMSLSSSSSCGRKNDSNVFVSSVIQEMKLLDIHFASLKTLYLSLHRVIDLQDIEDIGINELLTEAGIFIKEINDLFDDLEFSVSVLENTLDESGKIQEYSKVFRCKGKLLTNLLEMYEKLIIIFQTVFEGLDFKEMLRERESLDKKLKVTEKKSVTQEAVIKDLERRLSIYQGKVAAMESYKTNLENAKAELEKQLSHKEYQIKYLNNELLNVSSKQEKSDNEGLLEIIEGIKTKAHNEKSALKKALKFQKSQTDKNEEKCQKILKESAEKEKMLYDIAAQRDQLKVQLTVLNNNNIQQKSQIEEVKLQNLKLQNELSEKDVAFKKEKKMIETDLEEKTSQLDKTLKVKQNLEKTIEDLENELQMTKKQLKVLKEETEVSKSTDLHKNKSADAMHEEMHRLITLLQSTKDTFENLRSSALHVTPGDQPENEMEWNRSQNEILVAVKETKEHLVELKNLYKALQEQTMIPAHSKKNELEKQFRKLEQLYNTSVKENEMLRLEIEEMKNTSVSSSAQKTDSYIAVNMPSDNFTRKLQLELVKKSDEILKMKYEFQQKERDLENQLREYRDGAKSLENDKIKAESLERELSKKKVELTTLQLKKDEEVERLLHRTKELQNSLDVKTNEYEASQRFVQLLRSTYFKVFGDS